METKLVAEQVADHLTSWLGKHNAKNAVKMLSKRILKRPPEELSVDDLSELINALKPMLRTLIGEESTEVVLESLRRDVK